MGGAHEGIQHGLHRNQMGHGTTKKMLEQHETEMERRELPRKAGEVQDW